MKKSTYILTLFFSLILLGLAPACKKKDPQPSPSTSTKASLLIKTWKMAKVSQTGQATPLYQNPLPAGQSIQEDYAAYRLAFTSATDYTLTQKDGSTKTGKWELASNETKLILDKGVSGSETTMDIQEIAAASLKLRTSESNTKTGTRELLFELIPQ